MDALASAAEVDVNFDTTTRRLVAQLDQGEFVPGSMCLALMTSCVEGRTPNPTDPGETKRSIDENFLTACHLVARLRGDTTGRFNEALKATGIPDVIPDDTDLMCK